MASARNPLLEKMRRNPKSDWDISHVKTLCRKIGLTLTAPSRGSHYHASSPHVAGHLSIPAKRPIKPVYIKMLVGLCDAHVKFRPKRVVTAKPKTGNRKGGKK